MNDDRTTQAPGTRTVLADRQPAVRHGMRVLATQALGMKVVGEADTWPALQCQVREQKPDLVIVAWDLVTAYGEPPITSLRAAMPDLRVIVLGLRPETCDAALTAGADRYISTVDAPDVVVRVLRSCLES
jgi:DNA-binding NarL/FixJ family response regulator